MSRTPGATTHGRIVASTFEPAWWLPGPHAQTLWPVLARRKVRTRLRRERLELPDGDFVDLDWAGPDDATVVALFHGLEGNAASAYAAGLLEALARRGRRAVLMHFRGCSGEPNRNPRSYHSGDTGDIAFLIATLARRSAGRPVAAVGYSLGGNALLKYLGERGADAGIAAAVAVSVPFDLLDAATRLERGFSRLYQRRLLAGLKGKVRTRAGVLAGRIDLLRAATASTFREFDDVVTAPLHGFAGADDYYRRSSSRHYLHGISVPTLLLHARDDPFMTPAAIPPASALAPPVELELSAHGGHVGFVTGRIPGYAHYWLESRIPAFLDRFVDKTGVRLDFPAPDARVDSDGEIRV
ncbi:MAG: hydrolase [Gammaproteobacteria bacterium]|nr:hydrolase [Gammaproteobacteria bacterium]